MPESAAHRPEEPSPADAVEALLAQCLAADDPDGALAAAAAGHPEHAAALRSGFQLLCRAGLAAGERSAPLRLGRFRLLGELGGGGMGIVHLAEEEPLGRPVALKRIRPEMLHFAGARERFLREIAAVAALQHPGIVPIYSYGEAEGVPYYAMERIAGRSLAGVVAAVRAAGHLDPGQLHQAPADGWTEACFRIAAQVADALEHAHARGIVHRDVKPSNVMLADDGRALLIDFGLAHQAGSDTLTRSGVQPGSLAYMSPEQVRGETVDPRTDVWSLGVLLYELLTQRSPFAAETEERTRRRILEGSAPDVRRSGSGVPWDAAVVLATAMAPERERRYATMRDFAADLRAFVEHRAIRARRPSALLRLRRYAQRRPALATGIALGALLLVTGPTALYLAERATRHALQREAETARAAVTFLEDLFAECDPARARGATVPARTILDRGVSRVRNELRAAPEVQAALLEAMGSAYLNLGLFAEAGPLLDDARRLREEADAGSTSVDRVLQLQARLCSARGDEAGAEALWRRVVAALPAMDGPDGAPAAEASLQLAHAVWRQDRTDDAEALMDSAVAALQRLLSAADPRLGKALLAHGLFLQERDDPKRAESKLQLAERILVAALPADHPDVIAARCDLARNARTLGKHSAAATTLAAAETAARRVFDGQHPQLAMIREEMAMLAMAEERHQDGEALLEQALAAYRAIHPAPNHVLARAINLRSSFSAARGDLRAADTAAREALRMYEELYPVGHLDMAAALCNLAMVQTEVGNTAEASRLARRSLAMQDRLGQRNAATRALTEAHLAYALAFAGEFVEAEQLVRDAVARVVRVHVEPQVQLRVRCCLAEVLCLQRKGKEAADEVAALLAANQEPSPTWRGWALFLQGWAQELQKDFVGAEASLRQALALRQSTLGPRHPLTGIVLGELGVVLANRRQLDEAAQALAEAVDIRREHGGPDDVHVNLPLLNLGTVRLMQGRRDEAAAAGEECLRNLRGKAGQGHPVAYGTTKLLWAVWRRLPDADERRARLTDLQEFAYAVLPPGDPLQQELATALQALGR